MLFYLNKKEKTFIKLFLFIFIIFFHNYANSISITFIVPGKSNEDFWVNSAEFTRAAALNLGFEFEVLYAERDRLYMLELAKNVSERKQKPDFVFIVNEKQAAPQMLQVLNKNKIHTILTHIDLTEDQKEVLKTPRENLKYWLATIYPDNVNAGYQIANEIYKKTKKNVKNKKNYSLVAINGDKSTKASLERELGLNQFLLEHKNITLYQIISAEWERQLAYEKMLLIQKRYHDIDMIWAANDPIALGALKAVKEKNRKPGKDIFIGGLNWQQEALQEIKNGSLSISLGGHFMTGACAVIILYDYLHGIDIKEKNYEMNLKIFSTINENEAEEYTKYLDRSHWKKINFKKLSKFLNPQLNDYDFDAKKILKSINNN
ncbi:substrate-binding domain-containing protein [Silvanigrella paludirubra]|uniref:Substrate-binding domain-containing protein n=1 Tax=Silvanigrella paludirubra TaxID=2499159 RepID=A0A6N6VQ12_9BACT|nr:ABC transporter substrate-binding protein [Silvanigrella paludirubra]KAB8037046.1 substrate-binding domain-containing protein [Silvanigrella paludirubra]